MFKNDERCFIAVLRRSKNMSTSLKEPSLHLTIKIRALSRHTSKETKLSRSLPRKLHQTTFSPTLSSATPSLPRQGGTDIVLCTAHLYPAVLQGQTYAKSFTQHNKQKSRPIRPPIGNACSPKTTRNNEAKQLFENQMRKNKTSLRENKNRHKNAVKDIEISPFRDYGGSRALPRRT